MMPLWVQIIVILGILFNLWVIFYKMSETTHVLIRRYIFRDRIAVIVGCQYDFQSGPWKSPIIFDEKGEPFAAYRYPAAKIGKVSLNKDGTGDYCGQVLWKEV
jgi:hypothetical protein